jgi:uncharacterized protein
VFFALYSPSIIGFGAYGNQFSSDIVAWMTWIISIGLAEYMRRRSFSSPAEKLLRRLTYRKN